MRALCCVAALLAPLALVPVAAHAATATNGRIVYSVGPIPPDDPDPNASPQIWSVAPDGTDRHRLTHLRAPARAGEPDASPDGRRILYVSNQGGGAFQVWLMRSDGSAQHRVVDDPGHDAFVPRWAPDGAHLLFTRCSSPFGFTECTIAQAALDGTGLHDLTGGHWADFSGAYSPDGETVSFSGDRAGFASAIFAIPASGGRPHRLTDPYLEAFWPDYSPDGRRVLFGDDFDRPHTNLWTMRSDGTHPVQISHVPVGHDLAFARYAPDGQHIVANYLSPSSGWLVTLNSDGTGLTRIVRTGDLTLADWAVSS